MRFTTIFRQRFGNQMVDKYERYMLAAHPFTMDRDVLYWIGWTAEEAAAMKLLKNRHIIGGGNKVQIQVYSIGGLRDFIPSEPVCTVQMAERYNGYPWPDVVYHDTQISDQQLRADLLSWCVGTAKHTKIKHCLLKYVQHVVSEWKGVNTPGQLFRIWPELASMMPEKQSQRVMGQKLRSALPHAWCASEIEKFRTQPYFGEINDAIMAISLMELDSNTNLYPTVT